MLQQEVFKQFFKAMEVEIDDHKTCKHWNLMEHKDLTPGTKTIMAIWSFKHKWFPDRTLHKHKSRLCAHVGQQTWGQDYWEPVENWASVQLLLIIAKIHGLESKTINFVLAFLQAVLDVLVCMELPANVNPVDVSDENWRCYVLKLNKSFYRLMPAGCNWFKKLREGLSLATLFKVKLTSTSSFEKIALSSFTLMIVLSLKRQ